MGGIYDSLFNSQKKTDNFDTNESNPPEYPIYPEYKWGKLLKEGITGEVYIIEFKGKKFVAKKIPKNKLVNEKIKKAYEKEIDTLYFMNECGNSIRFFDEHEEENYYILEFELCDCKLIDIIKKYQGLNEDTIFTILNQLNNALMYIYKLNILLKDINPENILIKYGDSSKLIPKIKNYGLSNEIKEYYSTKIEPSIYIAPEILIDKNYSQKEDLWSLGIMIYYMHFQEYPFDFPITLNNDEIKKFLDKKKKKDFKDKNLDDLVNSLLVFDVNKRINWEDYFNHPFFMKKLKRFSGNQYILIKVDIKPNTLIRLINNGNESDWIFIHPIRNNELNEDNTDMYIDDKLTKFKKYLYESKAEKQNDDYIIKKDCVIKYVFDHKLKTLDYMFFACNNIKSIKFVNVDTSYLTSMKFAFSDCGLIEEIDLSRCSNAKSLKNIYNCFFGTNAIKCDLSSFDFKNIEESGAVFGRGSCLNLILSKKINKQIFEKFGKHLKITYV